MKEINNLVREWIKKAEHDFGLADLARENKPDYSDLICFHYQQSAEKYLKSLLVHHDILFPKTHSLKRLLEIISHQFEISENILELPDILDEYAIDIRYPDDFINPSEEEVEQARSSAVLIKSFVLEKLNEK